MAEVFVFVFCHDNKSSTVMSHTDVLVFSISFLESNHSAFSLIRVLHRHHLWDVSEYSLFRAGPVLKITWKWVHAFVRNVVKSQPARKTNKNENHHRSAEVMAHAMIKILEFIYSLNQKIHV